MTLYNQVQYLTHKAHALCDNGSVANCPHRHVLLEYLLSFKGLFTCLFLILQWFGKAIFHQDVIRLPLHWRHNEHYGVSNHQPHSCLLNRLFRRRSKKTSKFRVTGLCVGNSPGQVNSPHKGPVTRKMFPFDDVIMYYRSSDINVVVSLCNSLIKYEKKPLLHIADPLWG